ncbi:MAG: M48 family metalloprotease [Pseudomonadota bacterium]|nr:M48 family metalloprotease [Pseudomonadota bacterium]
MFQHLQYNKLMLIRRFKLLFIVVVFTSALSGCAKNPVSGMPDFVTITEQQEISMGASYHSKILKEFKIMENRELNNYFEKLGQRIAKNSHRAELNWHFTLIDSPMFNAFATPGGYIYFYRGILPYFNSEEELVGVLGHEIGHVTARHAVRGMSAAQITNILIGLVAARVPGSQITDNAFNLLNMAINSGYSRKFELEADQLGREYLSRTNYNPNAMKSFLKVMKDRDDLEKKMAEIEGREPNVGYHGIFSSHPDTEKRIDEMKVKEKSKNSKRESKNKEKFLKMIDGMMYGSSPEDGYVKGNTFFHPGLAIKFNFDESWLLQNNPDNIILNKNGSELIIRLEELLVDDLENGLTPEKFLIDGINKTSFLTKNELVEKEEFNYNGFTGYTMLYASSTAFNTMYKRFTAIFDLPSELKNKKGIKPKVWIFVSKGEEYKNDTDSKTVIKTFSKMTDKEIRNSKGLRIKVIRFRKGMSYEKLAKESPLGTFAQDKLRLLNGHYPNDNPKIGDLIKIVQ